MQEFNGQEGPLITQDTISRCHTLAVLYAPGPAFVSELAAALAQGAVEAARFTRCA